MSDETFACLLRRDNYYTGFEIHTVVNRSDIFRHISPALAIVVDDGIHNKIIERTGIPLGLYL
jgi:hypothetical protein